MIASTFTSTPLSTACNLLICNRFYFLKLLIILWSLVRVQVGPPLKKRLIRVAFFLSFSYRYTHLKAVFSSETALLLFNLC